MRILAILLSLAPLFVCAQVSIYPTLEKDELLSILVEDYKPFGLMTYGPARDSMYREVYRDADGYVSCYYTGYSIFLPEDVDPSSFLYRDGDDLGITAEHIFPQSKGAAEGDARSDMHALVPAIWRANERRSNYPFGEVPDDETDHWYRLDEDLVDTPTGDIDLYSELLNGGFGNPGKFEPRESIKGDVARAVFYFYTMYKAEADTADPDFFEEMKEELFVWHLQDPVDSTEYVLNQLKAPFQVNKLNPFILDCTLVSRAYFDGEVTDCSLGSYSTDVEELNLNNPIKIFPNPTVDYVMITSDYPVNRVWINDVFGQQQLFSKLYYGQRLDTSSLGTGLFIVNVDTDQGVFTELIVKR